MSNTFDVTSEPQLMGSVGTGVVRIPPAPSVVKKAVEDYLIANPPAPGKDGEPGEPGVQGPAGEKGDPGAPGKSAYEYAQQAGYSGTEEEFASRLNSDPVVSWDDLADRPFDMENAVGPISIPNDLDLATPYDSIEGLDHDFGVFYKVDTSVNTPEKWIGGHLLFNRNGVILPFEEVIYLEEYGVACIQISNYLTEFDEQGNMEDTLLHRYYILFVLTSKLGIPTGVYFSCKYAQDGSDVPLFPDNLLTLANESTKCIPEQHIPDTIARKEDIPEIPEFPNAVLTVNGKAPDENGNVEIEAGGSGGPASASDEEMLQLLMDMDIVQPLSTTNGVIYTDNNNKLYVL